MSNVGGATKSKSSDFYSVLDFSSSYNIAMMIKIVIVIVSVNIFIAVSWLALYRDHYLHYLTTHLWSPMG